MSNFWRRNSYRRKSSRRRRGHRRRSSLRRRRSCGKRSSRRSKTTGYLVFKIRTIYHHQVGRELGRLPSHSTGMYGGRPSSEKEKETGAVVALQR